MSVWGKPPELERTSDRLLCAVIQVDDAMKPLSPAERRLVLEMYCKKEDLENKFTDDLAITVENARSHGVDPHEIVTQLQSHLADVVHESGELENA